MEHLPLTPTEAYLYTAAHATIFVGSLYLFRFLKDPALGRDDPATIRQRIFSLLVAIASSFALNIWVIGWALPNVEGGFKGKNLLPSVGAAVLATITLFAGPILVEILDMKQHGAWWQILYNETCEKFSKLTGWRDVVLAPIFEEVVFRGLVVPLWTNAGLSETTTIFLSPIFFGLSHLHHAIDIYHTTGSMLSAILGPTFQALYSSMFGWFAVYLLLSTDNIMGPIFSHGICNTMGFPELGKISNFPAHRNVIWFTYILGIVGFGYLVRSIGIVF
ncbi:CAAX prenyl protease [Dimargaris verticillata]|uniref:intramembrane prenyl-peptidase Rce1 n=1 Tax=Dimargaris verticillata TaxID=2761393 RepID=A0A9W8E7D1_9FUNG|nr:CAAX prenyl protease [Dimargaris verticillata]